MSVGALDIDMLSSFEVVVVELSFTEVCWTCCVSGVTGEPSLGVATGEDVCSGRVSKDGA